jgi:hypothetical protein
VSWFTPGQEFCAAAGGSRAASPILFGKSPAFAIGSIVRTFSLIVTGREFITSSARLSPCALDRIDSTGVSTLAPTLAPMLRRYR